MTNEQPVETVLREEPEPCTALQELADILEERLLDQARGAWAASSWL